MPFSVINPAYNVIKAWIQFWNNNLLAQLSPSDSTSAIKVAEIAPPTVGTDTHGERWNPRDNKKQNNDAALPVNELMKEIIPKLEKEDDMVSTGMGNDVVKQWNETMGKAT